MTTLRNSAREKLAAGHMAIGFSVRLLRTVEVAPAAKAAGYDWLWLDCEHGTLSLDQAAQIAVAALESGIAPIVRVPNGEYSLATRILDNGALGIVIPHVDTAEEAREVVQKLKYPPVGHRSIGGTGPHYGLRSLKVGDAAKAMNESTLVVVMLETPRAIENVEAIAAVPGIDVLLIGSNDLCAEMGIPGEFTHERVGEAYGKMIAACRKHGKYPGMAGIYTESIMQRYIDMGARFVLGGGDAALLMGAATSRASNLRKMVSA
jgi:2-keto-3-deoxy-L-rhamnonate aldolase RhmA